VFSTRHKDGHSDGQSTAVFTAINSSHEMTKLEEGGTRRFEECNLPG
jgi:hypothetical protein